MFLVEPQVVDLLRHCPNAEDALRPVIDLQLHILQGENPAEGDDRGTKCATGGKRTVRPGDIGHQEDIGEWQGGHRRGYSKDHSGRSFIGIHPVSLLSDLEISPRHVCQKEIADKARKAADPRQGHLRWVS